MNRSLFLLHRYLGIGVGAVLAVWCLSGIVMMYVQYPEMTAADEARALEPLELGACCELPWTSLDTTAPIEELRIEMMAGSPVLRIVYSGGERRLVSLADGADVPRLAASDADAVAQAFAEVSGIQRYTADGTIERDQWTVYGAYDVHRPLYRYRSTDARGTQWYVSSATGEVVQITTARERFWNWLGAVPHWLYPTLLRQHTRLWSQTVIWLTIIGTFLTLLGAYVGLRQFRSRRSGRYSPYRGPALWHHYAGLVFGTLMLTWLVSGFFSMNPWGALESRSFAQEREAQRGIPLSLNADLIDTIERLPAMNWAPGTVRIEAHSAAGRPFLVAWGGDGRRRRPREDLADIASFTNVVLHQAAQRMRPDIEISEARWIDTDDAYYYSHHEERELPVYRIIYADGERFYLDGLTGDIVYAVDANRRLYRWLHYALHRGDFAASFRARPTWDAFMLPLMIGVSISALTGTWMGFRRVRRWWLSKDRPLGATGSVLRAP